MTHHISLGHILSTRTYSLLALSGTILLLVWIYLLREQTTPLPDFLRAAVDGAFGPYSLTWTAATLLGSLVTAVLFGIAFTCVLWGLHHHRPLGLRFHIIQTVLLLLGLLAAFASSQCPTCPTSAMGLGVLPWLGIAIGCFLGSVWIGTKNSTDTQKAKLPRSAPSIEKHPFLTSLLIIVFLFNQWLIGSVSAAMGYRNTLAVTNWFAPESAAAKTILMPMVNADGLTTSITPMPTITEIPGEPSSSDTVANAMAVMIARGTPFYAPAGIHFDDAVGALDAWGQYASLPLSAELEQRYTNLINRLACNFCCGSPTQVTINARCGCAHANAARGFFRFMLNAYDSTYSDDELLGEAYRWQAIWYPSGVVEDYLLVTGRGNILGHKTHGGAGQDGRHGL